MKISRAYKLKLEGNSAKNEILRYSHNRFLSYTQIYAGKLFFNGNKPISTKGLGTLVNQAQHKSRGIIKALKEASKATGDKINVPELKNIGMPCKIEVSKNTYDYWIRIPNQWTKHSVIRIPCKSISPLNKALKDGWELSQWCEVKKLKGSWYAMVFVSKEVEVPKAIDQTKTLGVDVGVRHSYASSDGILGFKLGKVLRKLQPRHAERQRQRMKHGQVQTLYKNKKSTIKQLLDKEAKNLVRRSKDLGCSLVVESSKTLANLKYGRLQGWARCYLATRLKTLCSENSVFFIETYAGYSSQECSACGERDRKSRHKATFKCTSCGHKDHADINASKVLSFRGLADLSKISRSLARRVA